MEILVNTGSIGNFSSFRQELNRIIDNKKTQDNFKAAENKRIMDMMKKFYIQPALSEISPFDFR